MSKRIVLSSRYIYDGIKNEPYNGTVVIEGNQIIDLYEGAYQEDQSYSEETTYINLENQLICPGFVDTHTFFTGYALAYIGYDFSDVNSVQECMTKAKHFSMTNNAYLLGHGLPTNLVDNNNLKELLDEVYPNTCVVLFSKDGRTALVNEKASELFGFQSGPCKPEQYYKLMPIYLSNKKMIAPIFDKYMKELNAKGITAIKEMGFDSFYGFLEILEEKEKRDELTLRVAFMSQPQGKPMNLDFAREAKDKYKSNFLKFSGFNRMIDGTIANMEGHVKQNYQGSITNCKKNIDYDAITQEVMSADEAGFRYTLHAQGDMAVCKALDIFDKCLKEGERCSLRHGITDLEFTDPIDLERMGRLGVIAEIYPQVMSLDSRETTVNTIDYTIGKERRINYWNRRKMAESSVLISCATDLPLMFPDIPTSILHSSLGYFSFEEVAKEEPFNKQNLLSVKEVLDAWSYGGQYNLGNEEILGTLEIGKLADIAILSENIFDISASDLKNVKAVMTICNGRIVHSI